MNHLLNICNINGAEVEPDECVERNPTDGRTGTRKGGLMRTPDEIVKALRGCGPSDQRDGCAYLPDDYHVGCYLNCPNGLKIDAAALIESLQEQLAEAQQQFIAAVNDLNRMADGTPCTVCRHKSRVPCTTSQHADCFKWRGPKDEKGDVK